nr:hypothetical protein [Ferrovum myxofaciens]
MSPSLKHTLCERAGETIGSLTNLAAQLLAVAAQRQLPVLDDKLYLEVFASPQFHHPLNPAQLPGPSYDPKENHDQEKVDLHLAP